jgi:hypothetical protein
MEVSERPRASPLARWEASRGAEWVTCLCHSLVELDKPTERLIRYLDGTRDVADLESLMAGTVPADEIRNGWVTARLQELANVALLIA